jgi:signal transduction histidine kinase
MKNSHSQKELLFKSILDAQEDERNRIARDIHDGIGGLLSGAKIQLGNILSNDLSNSEMQKIIKDIYGYITRASIEARNATHALTPASIALSGIKGAIDQLCVDFKEHFEVEQINNFPEFINIHYEIQIYRIIQELFNNTLKHSKATKVLLSIQLSQNTMEIKFEDNGVGFEFYNRTKEGYGLTNIKNRINFLEGNLHYSNNSGSTYLITLNLNKLK